MAKLFEPIEIRGMTLKNRIMMAPMDVGVGYRGQRARNFYRQRAKGGVGAIIPAAISVDLLATDDAWEQTGGVASFIEGLHLLTDEVHRAGARIGLQLFYAPRFPSYTGSPDDTRGDLVGPSARIEPDPPVHAFASALAKVRELTIEEIEEIISRFAKGAASAKQAGFDFVELHGAHGYLLCQFFSPLDNRRNDKYGGDLARRMYLGLESVRAVREAVGDDYPIFYRIGATEDRPGGISVSDSIEFAIELEKASVDAIDVSIADPILEHLTWPNIAIPTSDFPMGTFTHLAELIKRRVSIAVITVGRINTLDVAAPILSQGKADLVAIGRQLIAEPFWPDKVAKGDLEDITPCLSCNTCLETGRHERNVRCAVNASVGKEAEYGIIHTEKPKKVLVVGGGPAGMEAARVAAIRGHKVTLYEKDDQLGGKLPLASIAPYKEQVNEFRRYLVRQIDKTSIQVKLGRKVTAKTIEASNPDAVVISTGALLVAPDILGISGANVATALDIISGRKEAGYKAIIVGGGMVGCETAEFLAQQGRKVIILEMMGEVGSDIEPITRSRILQRLGKAGVRIINQAEVMEITKKGVKVALEREPSFFEADTVVLACGMELNFQLTKDLNGKVSELHTIGDCVKPGKIVSAIGDGARVGREI